MRQSKVKRIRKEINSTVEFIPTTYEYKAGNMDLEKRIEKIGLERVIQVLGYAPLTCRMNDCSRLLYKKAKRL